MAGLPLLDALATTTAAVIASADICPWSDLAPGTVHFCEERLCAWVVEPSNAWSSLAYVIIGIAMLVGTLRGTADRRDAIAVGVAVAAAQIMIGVGSFFFHGTGTFVGEVVDQVGMFMLSALILALAAGQARGWSAARAVAAYVVGVVVSTGAILVVRPLGIPLFALQLAIGLGWQIRLWRQSPADDRVGYGVFFRALGVFLFSFAIWTTDISGLLCDPTNHLITGHAVWHVLNAVCVWRLGIFYRQRFSSSSTLASSSTSALA